jgi:hypothetical protein
LAEKRKPDAGRCAALALQRATKCGSQLGGAPSRFLEISEEGRDAGSGSDPRLHVGCDARVKLLKSLKRYLKYGRELLHPVGRTTVVLDVAQEWSRHTHTLSKLSKRKSPLLS